MEQLHETLNDAPRTQGADATFARAEASPPEPTAELYLIKHKRSHDYFSYGHWTIDATEAQTFRSAVIAMSVAEQCGLGNVELEQQSVAA
jgi:hypothetical protein